MPTLFFCQCKECNSSSIYSAARVFNSDFISSSSSDAFLSAVASRQQRQRQHWQHWQQRQRQHWQQCVSDATRAASRCLFTPSDAQTKKRPQKVVLLRLGGKSVGRTPLPSPPPPFRIFRSIKRADFVGMASVRSQLSNRSSHLRV